MAVKPLPSETKIRSVEWRLIQPSQVNRSGYTGKQQVVGLPGASRWMATVEWVPFNSDAEARALRGFLASLEGQVHSFYLPVLNQSGALSSGQYRTHTLTNGRKQMVMMTGLNTFVPPLRGSSSSTETAAPYCEVSLTADTVAWISQPGMMFDFPPIEVEEVI